MTKNIVIVHPYFNVLGGAEYLCLTLIEALTEANYKVYLYSIYPPDLSYIRHFYNINLKDRMIKILKINTFLNFPIPTLFKKMITFKRIIDRVLKYRLPSEPIIIDTQLNIPWSPDITYIHFPYLIEEIIQGVHKKSKKRFYYKILFKLYHRLFSQYSSKIVLTNSTWTLKKIKLYYGNINTHVLYPPVDIDYFLYVYNNSTRDNIIVTISRLSPEKRIDKILDIATKLPDYTFIIIGYVSSENTRYLQGLLLKKENKKLNNVEILTNISRRKLLKILCNAKYYLHPPFEEHFGISIVESIAAGLIPIVFKGGGSWTDIVSKISPKLGYRNINEIINIIKILDSDHILYNKLRNRGISLIKLFSKEIFKKRFLDYITYISSQK